MNERISFYCRIERCSFYNEIIHRIEQKNVLKNAMLWSDHVRPQSNQTLKCQNQIINCVDVSFIFSIRNGKKLFRLFFDFFSIISISAIAAVSK